MMPSPASGCSLFFRSTPAPPTPVDQAFSQDVQPERRSTVLIWIFQISSKHRTFHMLLTFCSAGLNFGLTARLASLDVKGRGQVVRDSAFAELYKVAFKPDRAG